MGLAGAAATGATAGAVLATMEVVGSSLACTGSGIGTGCGLGLGAMGGGTFFGFGATGGGTFFALTGATGTTCAERTARARYSSSSSSAISCSSSMSSSISTRRGASAANEQKTWRNKRRTEADARCVAADFKEAVQNGAFVAFCGSQSQVRLQGTCLRQGRLTQTRETLAGRAVGTI